MPTRPPSEPGWFKRKPLWNVHIHMKSGKTIDLKGLTEFTMSRNGLHALTKLSWTFEKPSTALDFLLMSEVEAITSEQVR